MAETDMEWGPRSLRSVLIILVFSAGILVEGANREKTLVNNADDSVWALEKDSIRLICNDRSTAGAVWTRRWKNGTETFINAAITAGVGSVLTLAMSESLNGSLFRCQLADRKFSVIFSSGLITLLLGDEIGLSCTSDGILCVSVGSTLTKNCVITGVPEPSVIVFKLAGKALSERVPSANSSGLTFDNVALTDRGTYRLIAKSVLQEKGINVTVATETDICLSPIISLLSIPASVNCYTSTIINFRAKGIPTPRVTLTPSLSGRATVGTANTSTDIDGVTFVQTTLEIKEVKKSDSELEFCATADNSISPNSTQCFRLNTTCQPPGIVSVIVEDVTNASALLSVTPGKSEKQGITWYTYQLQKSDNNENLTSRNVLTSPILITNLTENTAYYVSVAAVNRIGTGPFTEESVETRGRPDKTTIRKLSSGCSEIILNYEQANDNGGSIEAYYVTYKREGTMLSRIISVAGLSATITGLNVSTTYSIQVRSKSKYGFSPWSDSISITTDLCEDEGSVATVGIAVGSTAGVMTVIVIVVVVVKKKKRSDSEDGFNGSQGRYKESADAQYAETGLDLTKFSSDGPIPGTVNNPSPKEFKHKKGSAGDNYAMVEKEPKDSYAKPDVTKKRKAQREDYAELDHEESGQAAAKPFPKVADKNEKTIYADMNPEQPKPRDH